MALIRALAICLALSFFSFESHAQVFPRHSTIHQSNFWLWGGVGGSYFRYEQVVPSIDSDVAFNSFTGPSLYGGAGLMLGEDLALDGFYHDVTGTVKSSATVTLAQNTVRWTNAGIELMDVATQNLNLKIGVQQHTIPITFVQLNSPVQIRQTSMMTATAGFDWRFGVAEEKSVRPITIWTIRSYDEMSMRYQYPVQFGTSDGNQFSGTPVMSFDGSVGHFLQIQNFTVGVIWYGQFHQVTFKYTDAASGDVITGSQNMFISNLELRMGFYF